MRWILNEQPGDARWIYGIVAIVFNSHEYYFQMRGLNDFAFRPEFQKVACDFY